MASRYTNITYKGDKGFWIYEVDMEFVFYFINLTFKKVNPKGEYADHIGWYLNTVEEGGFYDMLSLDWEPYLKTPGDEAAMIEILQQAVKEVEAIGETISTDLLMQSRLKWEERMRGTWKKPLKTTEIVKVINALILVMKGEWEWDAKDYPMELIGLD